nr:helix-turn-helix transcriptional regulator [Petrachloros mirabilis]
MKELRQKAGLKAEEVAVKLDIAVSTVRNWEQGRTLPKMRVDQFAGLCKLYSCTIEELEQSARRSIDKT